MTLQELEKRKETIEIDLLSTYAQIDRLNARVSLLRAEETELEIEHMKLTSVITPNPTSGKIFN